MELVEEARRSNPPQNDRPGVPDPEPPGDSSFRAPYLVHLIYVLQRHLILFLIAAVLTAVLATAVGLRREKVYQAHSSVLVGYQAPKVLEKGDDVYRMSHRPWEYARYYETQPSVITSREVLATVVQKLDLGEDDDFLGLADVTDQAEREQLRAKADPVKTLRGRVSVEAGRESMALSITVEDHDPERAADIANAIADAYINYYKEARSVATLDATDWLRDRVATLTGQVYESEEEILEFRREKEFLGTDLEESINVTRDRISVLTEAATRQEVEVLGLQADWEQAERLVAAGDPASIPRVQANVTIQDLKGDLADLVSTAAELEARYGERNPRLRRVRAQREQIEAQIDVETERIIASMEADRTAAENSWTEIERELSAEQERALALKEQEMEYHRLQRDLGQTEELYTEVNARLLEADLARMLDSSNISVLDRASVPSRPYKPRRNRVLLAAFALALAVAFAVVLLADRLDSSVRNHAQLEAEFGRRVIGILPRYVSDRQEAERNEDGLYVHRKPRSALAESCRTIRTNLMFMAPGQEIHRLLITSAGPSEGKTSLAVNLAYTMASAGKRVVLVDTDMRRPRVHKVFGMQKVGALTAALIGEVDLDAAIIPSGYANLDLVPLGAIPPNPAELIGSASFARFVEQLSARYDRVILDSPPVMAVTDASILAQHADGVLLVAREDKTNRHMLRQAIRSLSTVNANIYGFVLNDVDLDAGRRGYYGYGYRYRYPYYYYTYQYYSRYAEDSEEESSA